VILPIGDQPNPRNFTPLVTYALIALNVAVFVLISLPLMSQAADPNDPAFRLYLEQLMRQYPGVDPRRLAMSTSAYDVFVIQWGYRPAAPSFATLFSSMFLHGGWAHLLGNMLFLWIYGDNVEHRLGRLAYLVVYLLTGIAGTLSFALFVPASSGHVPLVGASGAISGVLGLYFLWFPRNKVRLFVFFIFYLDVWAVPARIVLGFYLLVDNLLPFLFGGGASTGVAHGAHIGGFVAGLAVAYGADRVKFLRRDRQARRGARTRTTAEVHQHPAANGAAAVVKAHARGERGEAVLGYLDLPSAERKTVPVAVAADLAEWLASNGEVDGALAIYRRAMHDHPRGPQLDRLLLGTGLLLLRGKQRPTAAYPYLLDVLDVDPSAENAQAARHALAEIAQMQKLPFGSRGEPN
jgi:membrane associated rhomboid family serine protease